MAGRPVIEGGRVEGVLQSMNPLQFFRSQALAIVVPPVEPTPKEWGEAALRGHWKDDVESLGGFCQTAKLQKQGTDPLTISCWAYFAGGGCPLYGQDSLNDVAASRENVNFGGVEQEFSVEFLHHFVFSLRF